MKSSNHDNNNDDAHKGNLFNVPPHSYCTSYSSLTESLTLDEKYPLKELIEAATIKPATCPITGYTIQTPFQPMAWALRLAATRYPYPAAAVTLVKCLRLGVNLGYIGDRSRIQIGPNLESAIEYPQAIDDNITAELKNGRRKGPYTNNSFLLLNPLGIDKMLPKQHK